MMPSTGIFLQARLGSTRLPGKALFELEGKPIITHAMEALGKTAAAVSADVRVLLTDHESFPSLAPVAEASGFFAFAGSAEDVLDRYLKAAEKYGTGIIIRATGDNPLVDGRAAQLILDSHILASADYSGFDSMPLGTGVEILDTAALERASRESNEPYDHEHVSPYLYKNPGLFKINRIEAPSELCLEGARVTVDTYDDYSFLKKLYADLYRGRPLSIEEIIPWLREHGDYDERTA